MVKLLPTKNLQCLISSDIESSNLIFIVYLFLCLQAPPIEAQ